METRWTAPARYADRTEAGGALGRALVRYRGTRPLVLGIPRGGVPVAAEVARQLDGELDVLVARKLGAPRHEELAIGAVTADGGRFLNEDVLRELGVTDEYLRRVTEEQMGEARSREQRFRGTGTPIPIEGRTVILVDDGLATGATMRAAARAVRTRRPGRLVVAVPVGAAETCAVLAEEADEVVCPSKPSPFIAIGLHYEDFTQVPDSQVVELLRRARA
ncbi:MAG TPA: phosphoribosyltransferase family protein [Gemmatimonadales bacterium]|jgi:putative phosphoribosyl transferase|nr:phosphoribosyltransferase family protein [Gemmatimonadales bacterium]